MSQPKRGRICPTNLQRCELWSCHTSGECDMKKEASNPPSATREIEPIGEVMGHDQKGLALVQWHDNGLRPVGMQVYGANFTRSQSRPRLGPNESIGNPGTLPRDAYAPSSIVEPEKLRGEERRKYIHDHDCPTAWAFFNKHASGSKVCPSCLTCGQQVHDREEWGITHLELPDIYVCKPCVAKLRSTASAIERKNCPRCGYPEVE